MRERFESTLQDIGAGTPREAIGTPPREEDEEEEEDIEDQQIESVKQLIEDSDVAMNQGQTGFTSDRIAELEPTAQVSDQPVRTIRRGRPTLAESREVNRRREWYRDVGEEEQANLPFREIQRVPEHIFNFPNNEETSGGAGSIPR